MKEDYPLFVAWYRLLNDIMDRTAKFPKDVRFTLTDRIVQFALTIMELVVEAIYSRERKDILERINLYMEKLRVLIRIGYDRKYLSIKSYQVLAEQMDEAGRMVGGWLKDEKGRQSL